MEDYIKARKIFNLLTLSACFWHDVAEEGHGKAYEVSFTFYAMINDSFRHG